MRKLKVAWFLAVIGFGLAASLGGCIVEDHDGGHGGGWHHDHHDWR